MLRQHLLAFQQILFLNLRRVHFPRPLHEVVGLVDEEDIVLFDSLREEPAQIGRWVEDIVVIADDNVGKKRKVKAQLIGADLILFRIRKNRLPADGEAGATCL